MTYEEMAKNNILDQYRILLNKNLAGSMIFDDYEFFANRVQEINNLSF